MATITNITIRFSNIGAAYDSNRPDYSNTYQITSKAVDGVPMVRLSDLETYMGATQVSATGTTWVLNRNGQYILFNENSVGATSSTSYSVYNPYTGGYENRTISLSITLPIAAQKINTYKYVPLYATAMQLGALKVYTNSSTEYTVFDFRVNGNNGPLTDTNTYVVGGPWVTNWSSLGSTNLSNHFKINEFWDKSSTAGAKQLKVCVALIAVAERIRYYYNNDSALNLGSAFRTYEYNKSLSGSWDRSFHMRGRAFDVTSANNGTALYNSLYNEFCGGSAHPSHTGAEFPDGFWRNNDFDNCYSKGWEIETMPRGTSTWLHVQVKPGVEDANYCP